MKHKFLNLKNLLALGTVYALSFTQVMAQEAAKAAEETAGSRPTRFKNNGSKEPAIAPHITTPTRET